MTQHQREKLTKRESLGGAAVAALILGLLYILPALFGQGRWKEFYLVLGVFVVAQLVLVAYIVGPERRAKALRLFREHVGQAFSGKWNCSTCGMKNPSKSLRCDNCGALNPTKIWECPICGNGVTKDLGICPTCGSTRPEPE